jgi:hypothetical protein
MARRAGETRLTKARRSGAALPRGLPATARGNRARRRGTEGLNPASSTGESDCPLFRTRRQNSRFGRSGALNARAGAGFEVGLVKTIDYRRAMPTVRRLAAILAADVAGYSRLMGRMRRGRTNG